MRLLPALAFAATAFATTALCRGAVLYQFRTLDSSTAPNDDGFVAADVTTTTAANILAPSGGAALAASGNGLVRFWNSEWAGFSLSSANGTAIDNGTEFSSGYFQLTVSAAPGFQISLTSLDFGSAVGGTGTRLYQLYGAVDGGAITFGDTPLSTPPGGVETGTRTTPRPVSVDLSGATYQDISSITFRYYPLTPASGNTMEFNGWTLNGTVTAIPEPSLTLLGLLACVPLLIRRRR